MDVAGALLPFTQIARTDLTTHVQEVLTKSEKEHTKKPIPIINEPDKDDKSDDFFCKHARKSSTDSKGKSLADAKLKIGEKEIDVLNSDARDVRVGKKAA